MAKQRKIWRLLSADYKLKKRLAAKLQIPDVIAQLLINRGLCDESEAVEFLYGGVDTLHSPNLLKDMHLAVERIAKAIDNKESITIYGDYDVDGMTATALVVRVLTRLGAKVNYYIPDRQTEGYGLNTAALSLLCEKGTALIVTVDCGINAVKEVNAIRGKADIIITDHHESSEVLPAAYAVLNPKRQGCNYPDKNLAGVGVAFKLCQALWAEYGLENEEIYKYLDLVALGSVADIVPLLGENRIMVKFGLRSLADSSNPGLKALLEACRLIDVDAGKVGFVLAPRLNAAGRVGNASIGVELLITEDYTRATEIAAFLEQQNSERQQVEKEILAQAEKILTDLDIESNKVIVLEGENWHPGVIGIVASRILDKYYRPVVVISKKDGLGKGSCRSIPGLDIYSALCKCADLLLKFGGHRLAAGLSIEPDKINELRKRLNEIADAVLTPDDFTPVLKIDATLVLSEVNNAFLEQLACLAPYGMGNPRPVFAAEKVSLYDARSLGRDCRHLKLRVGQRSTKIDAISWEMGYMAEELIHRPDIDIAFVPEINEWQGRKSIQLCAHDIKLTSTGENGNNRDIIIERMITGQVYLIINSYKKKSLSLNLGELSNTLTLRYGTRLTRQGIVVALTVLYELNLIELTISGEKVEVVVLPPPAKKLDIEQSVSFSQGLMTVEIISVINKN